jgi:Undecaprenyl-phosphate galactose phosphotransferase WbaP
MTPALLSPIPNVASAPASARQQPVEAQTGLLRLEFPRAKRIADIVVASILLLLALPLGVLIALLILLESGGPVFFGHARIGRGGRRFRLWKFRSMTPDGDALLSEHLERHPERAVEWLHFHKLKDDPRVTKVGRFLRKRSLDELPQLWNVLRGDMSMVGPRPIVDEEVQKYSRVFPLYTRVLPGLTGLWQVSGRTETSYRRRVELDTTYIRNWTLRLDLQILIRTVRVVLNGHGAY